MRKIVFLASLLLTGYTTVLSQRSQWDKPMELKSCFIDIKADLFTATTFIEMEFYNPNDQQIEGLHQFDLKPGQVITAFQLDLNGKYREGTIEERWKATNTYNSIVGKRIDPALLSMDYGDHYSLRIFPIPAKGTRKVTMTIQQLLKTEKDRLVYSLPLNIKDTAENFGVKITVQGSGALPVTRAGLIAERSFMTEQEQHTLNWRTNGIRLNNPIAFFIPLKLQTYYCTQKKDQQIYFALQLQSSIQRDYEVNPKQLTVFWDASGSSSKRNINKEINFLRQFIAYNNITQLTIIPFNYRLQNKVVFNTEKNGDSWKQYLQNLEYTGATQLGCIDVTGMIADMFMIFTDGNNTYGNKTPKCGVALVYAVHTSPYANLRALDDIVGSTGGKVIDLNKTTISNAIVIYSRAENWLLNITSSGGKTITEQTLPAKISDLMFINGTMAAGTDTLFFHFGNNNHVSKIQSVIINSDKQCNSLGIERVAMLSDFDRRVRSYEWQSILDFGLTEKVVTPNTSFIVLERVEDYIKYNIAPPKDLEAECERLNYVKKDTRPQRMKMQAADEISVIRGVVSKYNERLKIWDEKEKSIMLNEAEFDRQKLTQELSKDEISPTPSRELSISNQLEGRVPGLEVTRSYALDEVVVIGYGSAKRANLTGSVTYIPSRQLLQGLSVEQSLQGRVPGLNIEAQSSPGSSGSISIRGTRTLGENNTPLYVLDGIPVSGNINDLISVANIDNITVLKDVTASSIYGSRAANGAILITSKKGYYHYYRSYNSGKYKLKDLEDVDYILEIQEAPVSEKKSVYERLRLQNESDPGFYFDMAQHFFEHGMPGYAKEIIMNAAEASNGSFFTLRAMGYFFENWKQYDEAINIYQQLVDDSPENLACWRDLALAYYQAGNYQKAVDLLYSAISKDLGQQEWANLNLKSTMLAEMNAIISMYKDKLNIAGIPAAVIRPMPADLRIVLDCNYGSLYNVSVKDPHGKVSSKLKNTVENGGFLNLGSGPVEYQVKDAESGRYRISLYHYGYSYGMDNIPYFIRMVTFRNFGKPNQTMSIENMSMENQYGEIEIGEVRW